MIRFRYHILFAVSLLAVGVTPVLACSIEPMPGDWKRPAFREGAKCNFDDSDYATGSVGTIVHRMAPGTVIQRVDHDGACVTIQEILVADCNTGELLAVQGRFDPKRPDDFGSGPSHYISQLFPPHGAIRLTTETSLQDLRSVAESRGYAHRNTSEYLADMKEFGARYDPFCGCRTVFPGSVGASKSKDLKRTSRN